MTRNFCAFLGAALLATGVLGSLTGGHDHNLIVFGVNASHNVVHLVSGALALAIALAAPALASAFFLLFAIPMGRIADTLGRFRVFVAGHVLLIALYSALAFAPSTRMLIALSLPLLGLYYAATEGVLMALGSALLPGGLRTSGLAVLTTALAVARLGGSVLFGVLWTSVGIEAAVWVFLVGLGAAICIVAVTYPRNADAPGLGHQ